MFENQIKEIENQGEKQIKTIEEHGNQLAKSNVFAENNSIPIDKQEESIPLSLKETFYKLVAKRMGKNGKLNKKIYFKNLIYHFKGSTKNIFFSNFIDDLTLFNDIVRKERTKFDDAEKNHM